MLANDWKAGGFQFSRMKVLICAVLTLAFVSAGLLLLTFPGGKAVAQTKGEVPGQAQGFSSDSEIWRTVRHGIRGTVSLPDKQAGVLVQSEGDNWRAINNGPLKVYGARAMAATLVVLVIFFVVRKRIRIDSGFSGKLVLRFNGLDRIAHWLTAVSFIILGITGLNVMYGRYVLKPLIGADAFALFSLVGKYVHNYLGFVFIVGVVMMFVLWVKDNLPDRYDAGWIAQGGGLFVKGAHPKAARFNTGQKFIFWTVVIGGVLHFVTGLALLFPFTWADMAGMQLIQIIHSAGSIVMIAIIIAHIYIGSLGMEGAFDAMYSGYVDENWAREHHSAWVDAIDENTSEVQEV